MLRSGGLITFLFLCAAVVYGQGWQMYAEQIKEEAANRRKNEVVASEQAAPVAPAPRPEPRKPAQSSSAGLLSMPELDIVPPESEDTVEPGTARPETSVRAPSLPSFRDVPEMKRDATLRRVSYAPSGAVWIVGDRGTIVASSDDGSTWSLIRSPVSCDLYDICFRDERCGIIVGGELLPTGDGRGVILRTEDGGASWQEVATSAFPYLRRISLTPDGTLLVCGDSSELYPAGLFVSRDSGLTWTPDRSNRHEGWSQLAYDHAARTGFGIGSEGTLQVTNKGQCVSRHPAADQTRLHALTGDGAGHYYVVGDHGLILTTSDAAVSWQSLAAALPTAVAQLFDFKTAATRGPVLWVAGTPGSVIFKSGDHGLTWQPVPTGVGVTLCDLQFRDDSNGLATGELGTILKTNDGGNSWQVIRKGGDRLALLGMFGQSADIPWELFVHSCAEEGYLGGVALLAREEVKEKTNDAVALCARLQEAVVDAGASTLDIASSFRLDPDELNQGLDGLLARFDRENDRKGLDAFRDSLVRLLRTRRPSVVVIQAATKSPVAALISREMPGAVMAAADPLSCPEQLQDGFLAPWSVEKVCTLTSSETPNDSQILFESGIFCPALGRSTGEISREVRALFSPVPQVPQKTSLSVLYERQTAAATGTPTATTAQGLPQGLFSAVTPPLVGEARRARSPGLATRRDELVRRASEMRQKDGIAERTIRNQDGGRSSEVLMPQMNAMIQGVDAEAALHFLLQTGRAFRDSGNWSAAEVVYSLAVRTFPQHLMTREALLWLVPWYAGSEPARRADMFRRDSIREAVTSSPNSLMLNADNVKAESRLGNVDELGKLIREFHPDLYMRPEIRFPLAAAARQRGWTRDAVAYYMNRSMISGDDLWGLRAGAEFWLATPNKDALPEQQQVCPISVLNCRAIAQRPTLDGVLEPEFWGNAQTVSLSTPRPVLPDVNNPEEAWNTSRENGKYANNFGSTISLLYDKEYLYLALVCEKKDGVDYTAVETPRVRDDVPADADRIEIQLDADRDYTTFYQFVFDCHGRASESLWNDRSWNPRLFVAHKEDEQTWTIEAAIPWHELADHAPTRSDVWAVSVRRIIPRIGIECWNSEFTRHGNDGFGFLTFGF
ncbi:MAG: sugar-binding protein [Planctomycetia bacterium]|nr:sugar-binding protein [Planctomycetia bacterium]